MRSVTSKTFTLMEMLVVMSVIAVLTAMLLPALNKAKETARRILCVNNLKAVGYGLTCYMTDNSSYLPPANASTPGHITAAWAISIRDSLNNPGDNVPTTATQNEVMPPLAAPKGFLLCPSAKLAPDAGAVMRHTYQPTATCSSLAQTSDPAQQGGFQFWNAAMAGDGRVTAKSSNRIPSSSVLMVEKSLEGRPSGFPFDYNFPFYATCLPPAAEGQYAPWFMHQLSANFLTMDMSVATWRQGTRFDTNWTPLK